MLTSLDYIIFSITIILTWGLSIYFGCIGNKQKTATEYLYGSRKLKAIPIGLSLLGSGLSTNHIIGNISEIYIFGAQLLMNILHVLVSIALVYKLIIPIFCGTLKLKVPYEYFELRFGGNVRLIITLLYIFQQIVHPPFILYVAGLTFSEFTGMPLYLSCLILGVICTSYTCLGGFVGVIWTDVLQICLITSSVIFTLYRGLVSAGGIINVWEKSNEGQRLEFFNMDPNPFIRTSFWSVIIGMTVIHIAHTACSSSGIQRYLALNSEKEALYSTIILNVGVVLATIISSLIGLCIYVTYKNCDPLKSGQINNPSQLLSYFVNNLPADNFGFRGIFTAGIVSVGLSTLSAELNAVSGLLYYDVIEKYLKININEFKATIIMKIIIIIFGTIHIIIAPFIQNFKYFIQVTLTISSCTYGPKAGVMLLATTFPTSNYWGAITGLLSSILIMGWISIHALYYDLSSSYMLPLSTSNCTTNITIIARNITQYSKDDIPLLYQLSYMYYAPLGMLLTILIGLGVSYITGKNNVEKMDLRLIAPCVRPKYK